jgi:hypothetical protein
MFFSYGARPNQPTRVKDPRPVERYQDDTTGNAGLDGFTRLSRADRETGYRPPVGQATPEWPRNVED